MRNIATTGRKLYSVTRTWLLLALIVFISFAGLFNQTNNHKVEAATSSTINFQARLLSSTGALVPDGYYNVKFNLYTASSGGSTQWTEEYYDSNGVTAGNDNRVRVVNGYLSVYLGSLTSFPGTINWDQEQYLTLNIGGTAQTATPTYDGEMTPRLKLSATPYALTAGSLQKTSGANELKVTTATPTADVTYTFQDAAAGSYDVCTTATVCTGYASSSGSGSYIQNGTSLQTTANFNIQSAASGSVGGIIQGASGQTANLLQLKDSSGVILTAFDSAGKLVFGPSGSQDTNLYRDTGGNVLRTDDTFRTPKLVAGTQDSGASTIISGRDNVGGTTHVVWLTRDTNNTGAVIRIGGASNQSLTAPILTTERSGETEDRFRIQWGGALLWGDGAASPDTNLYRNAANELKTDDALTVAGTLTASGQQVVIQPASSLTSGQTNISQTLTNASSSGGTVTGYGQTITISNTSTASTTKGINISLVDNAASIGNTDIGLAVTLSGSNTTRAEVGVDSSVAKGIGLRAVSSGSRGNSSISCNGSSIGLGVCAGDSASSNAGAGLYAYTGSRATTNIYDPQGSGVYGLNQAGGTAGGIYAGLKGITTQSTNAAYTALGVYGKASGGTGASAYGGYFTLDSASTSTAGAALYASNSSTSANIFQLQDNTTDVFVVANGGNVTAAGTVTIQAAGGKTTLQLTSTGTDTGLTLGGDTNLYRYSANTLGTDDSFKVENANGENITLENDPTGVYFNGIGDSAADWLFTGKVFGDTDPRAMLSQDGTFTWGDGTGAGDTTLSRSAAGQLTANGDLVLQGGDLITNQTTANLFSTTATTVNVGTAATNASGGLNLAGGSGSTGCSVNGTNGNFTCSGTLVSGSSQAFLQNGNSMGATAVLGTNDSNSLAFETGGTSRWLINTSGHLLPNVDDTYDIGSDSARVRDLYLGGETLHIGASTSDEGTVSYNNTTDSLIFKNATNSTSAFQIQNAASASMFTVDTTNNIVNVQNNALAVTGSSFSGGAIGGSGSGTSGDSGGGAGGAIGTVNGASGGQSGGTGAQSVDISGLFAVLTSVGGYPTTSPGTAGGSSNPYCFPRNGGNASGFGTGGGGAGWYGGNGGNGLYGGGGGGAAGGSGCSAYSGGTGGQGVVVISPTGGGTNVVRVSGTSYTVPAGVTSIKVWAIGAGGGGAGVPSGDGFSGGAGAAGGVTYRTFTVIPGGTVSYSLGTAGAAGTGAVNGTTGGDTTVTSGATTIIGNGGAGGTYNDNGVSPGGAFYAGSSGAISATVDLTATGTALFKNSTNSTAAFRIQNSSGTNLLNVDTTNSQITIGTASSTPTILILGTKNTTGDPTCVSGGMYYNSSSNQAKVCINGNWAAVGVPTVTSLPGSPANGDEVYYQFNRGDGTNAYWHLKYNSSTTYWDYLGGPSWYKSDTTNPRTTASNVFQCPGAAAMTAPLTGDYDINYGDDTVTNNVAANNTTRTSVAINGVATGGTTVSTLAGAGGWGAVDAGTNRLSITSGQTFSMCYRSDSSLSTNWWALYMRITPSRVK